MDIRAFVCMCSAKLFSWQHPVHSLLKPWSSVTTSVIASLNSPSGSSHLLHVSPKVYFPLSQQIFCVAAIIRVSLSVFQTRPLHPVTPSFSTLSVTHSSWKWFLKKAIARMWACTFRPDPKACLVWHLAELSGTVKKQWAVTPYLSVLCHICCVEPNHVMSNFLPLLKGYDASPFLCSWHDLFQVGYPKSPLAFSHHAFSVCPSQSPHNWTPLQVLKGNLSFPWSPPSLHHFRSPYCIV